MDLKEFNELVKKREEIENEINENLEFLEKPENKNVGMKGKLIDAEGFPRNDIDIYSIRVARNKVICLRNDYLDINKKIEEYLHKVHSTHPVIRVERNKNNNDKLNENKLNDEINEEEIEYAKKNVFAIIDEIIENSPSHKAGIKIGDYIYQFGDVIKNEKDDSENTHILKKISDYMKSIPSKIEIKILREEKPYIYYIYPNETDKGLYIGCHLTPIKSL